MLDPPATATAAPRLSTRPPASRSTVPQAAPLLAMMRLQATTLCAAYGHICPPLSYCRWYTYSDWYRHTAHSSAKYTRPKGSTRGATSA